MFGDMLKKTYEELRPRLMAEGHEGLEFVVHKAHIPFPSRWPDLPNALQKCGLIGLPILGSRVFRIGDVFCKSAWWKMVISLPRYSFRYVDNKLFQLMSRYWGTCWCSKEIILICFLPQQRQYLFWELLSNCVPDIKKFMKCSWLTHFVHGAFLFLNHQDHVVGADSLLGFSRVFGMLTNLLQGGIQLVNGEVMSHDVINYNDEWFGVIYLVCRGNTIQDKSITCVLLTLSQPRLQNLAKIQHLSFSRTFLLVDLHFNPGA